MPKKFIPHSRSYSFMKFSTSKIKSPLKLLVRSHELRNDHYVTLKEEKSDNQGEGFRQWQALSAQHIFVRPKQCVIEKEDEAEVEEEVSFTSSQKKEEHSFVSSEKRGEDSPFYDCEEDSNSEVFPTEGDSITEKRSPEESSAVKDLHEEMEVGDGEVTSEEDISSDESEDQIASEHVAERKLDLFEKNVIRRGAVHETVTKTGVDYFIKIVLLGFFVLMLIGLCKGMVHILTIEADGGTL